MRRHGFVAPALGLLVTVALCACGPQPTSSPSPLTPPPIAILTQPSPPAGPASICSAGQVEGQLTEDTQSGASVLLASGQNLVVVWPFGFTLASSIGSYTLVNTGGAIVAHTGERLRMTGSMVYGRWQACGTIVNLGTSASPAEFSIAYSYGVCPLMGAQRVTFRIEPEAPDPVLAVDRRGATMHVFWSPGFVPGTLDDPVVRDPAGQVVARDGERLTVPPTGFPKLHGYAVCFGDGIYVLLVDPTS